MISSQKQLSKQLSKSKKVSVSKNNSQITQKQQNFNVFVTTQNNQIWLSSLGLAWKELTEKNGFKPELNEGSRAATSTIKGFCENSSSVDDIDGCVYFKGGLTNTTVMEINDALKEKYSQFNIQRVDPIKENQAILFGGLFKQIRLKYPFFQIPGKIMHFQGLKVPCFEPTERQQRQQVYVVDYTGQDNFIVRINLLEQDSYMFIVRSKEKVSINNVINFVTDIKEEDLDNLTDEDVFKIPQIKIRASQYLSEIIGIKGKVKDQDQASSIIDCYQTISLQMKGQPHRERMDNMVLLVSSEDKPSLKSRRMAVRGAFWLILKNKNKFPYMIMYVNKHNEQMQ